MQSTSVKRDCLQLIKHVTPLTEVSNSHHACCNQAAVILILNNATTVKFLYDGIGNVFLDWICVCMNFVVAYKELKQIDSFLAPLLIAHVNAHTSRLMKRMTFATYRGSNTKNPSEKEMFKKYFMPMLQHVNWKFLDIVLTLSNKPITCVPIERFRAKSASEVYGLFIEWAAYRKIDYDIYDYFCRAIDGTPDSWDEIVNHMCMLKDSTTQNMKRLNAMIFPHVLESLIRTETTIPIIYHNRTWDDCLTNRMVSSMLEAILGRGVPFRLRRDFGYNCLARNINCKSVSLSNYQRSWLLRKMGYRPVVSAHGVFIEHKEIMNQLMAEFNPRFLHALLHGTMLNVKNSDLIWTVKRGDSPAHRFMRMMSKLPDDILVIVSHVVYGRALIASRAVTIEDLALMANI